MWCGTFAKTYYCPAHEEEKHALLKILVSTVAHFFGGFRSIFGDLTDPRDPNRITYPLYTLAFAGVWMYLCRLGSRRQIAHQFRNNGPSSANIQTLLGVAGFPHGDTVNNAYSRLEVAEVQECVTSLSEQAPAYAGEGALSLSPVGSLFCGGYRWIGYFDFFKAALCPLSDADL